MLINTKTNSSWWLGQDFFENDKDILTGEVVTDRTAELIKLSGYRRAISNFVNIVTGKSDIPVHFSGSDSYTDGKSINYLYGDSRKRSLERLFKNEKLQFETVDPQTLAYFDPIVF